MKNPWIFTLFLLASCSSTKITSSWRNDRVPPAHYNKIMVLAMVPDNQRNIRRAMEQSMADQLTRNGIPAVSALAEFGPKAFEGLDEKASVAKARGSGADGLLTISQTDHRRTREYVPGTIYPSPWGWGWGWGGGYYSPGYTRSGTRFAWETNVYDVVSDKVLYSVQSKSSDPGSANELAGSYSRQIVRDMKKKGVFLR